MLTQPAPELRNRHDAEIRVALMELLSAPAPAPAPAPARTDALLVQEWAIDRAIVDVGVISADCIAGYEIKSAADSVTRLERQAPAYGRVFDTCTLVTTDNHMRHAEKTLPPWWGLWLWRGGQIEIERIGGVNIENNAARLLWSNELSKMLTEFGLQERAREEQRRQDRQWGMHVGCDGKCRKKPTKHAMMEAVAMSSEVRAWVARALLARPDWRLPNGRSARNYR